jgi:hypothetical protein
VQLLEKQFTRFDRISVSLSRTTSNLITCADSRKCFLVWSFDDLKATA